MSALSRQLAKAARKVAADLCRGLQGENERASRLARDCITDFLWRGLEWIDWDIADAKGDIERMESNASYHDRWPIREADIAQMRVVLNRHLKIRAAILRALDKVDVA